TQLAQVHAVVIAVREVDLSGSRVIERGQLSHQLGYRCACHRRRGQRRLLVPSGGFSLRRPGEPRRFEKVVNAKTCNAVLMDLGVTPPLPIPAAELSWRFSRSSGPGGQHVNTSDSRVELSWSVLDSTVLSGEQRDRLL